MNATKYWRDVARKYKLDSDETEMLIQYVQTLNENDMPEDTRDVVSNAMKPVVDAALEESTRADDELSDSIGGGHVSHGNTPGRTPLVYVHVTTSKYVLTCISDSDRFRFTIAQGDYRHIRNVYDSYWGIPDRYRKARAAAERFSNQRDLINAAINTHVEYLEILDWWKSISRNG